MHARRLAEVVDVLECADIRANLSTNVCATHGIRLAVTAIDDIVCDAIEGRESCATPSC